MRYSKILMILINLSALGACKKQVPECAQVTRAPQAFLDYWYFPEGSFWIYRLQGSSPAVYDTMRVYGSSESHTTYYSHSDPTMPCVQSYLTNITHSNSTYFPGTGRLGTEILTTHPSFYEQDWVLNHESDVRTLYSPEVGFGYPIQVGQKLLNRLTFVDTMAVVTPVGTFRQSVHLVPDYGSKVDSTQFNWMRHLYRSRYVGVTKVVYTNNQTWELTNYHINR